MARLFFINLVACVLLCFSCVGDESIRDKGSEGAEQILLCLPLTSSGMLSPNVKTRASDALVEIVYGENEVTTRVAEESKIEHVCVFLFSGITHKLIRKVYIPDIAATGSASVEIWLNKSAEDDKMYVVANMGDVTASYIINTTTIDQFEATTSVMETADKLTSGNLIPMIGAVDVNTASGSLPTVILNRLIAKVNFTCNTDLTDGGSFQYTAITLKNVPTFVRWISNGVVDPGADHLTEYALADNTYVTGISLSCLLPENMRGTNEAINDMTERNEANAPIHATYIEVRGKYTPSGGGGAPLVTFLLYLGNGDLGNFNIERNHTYTVKMTIKAVKDDDPRVEIITNLNADKTANCYLVTKDNAVFSFDATVKGNGSTSAGNTSVETELTPASAKVLWEMGADPAVAPNEGDIIQKGSVILDGDGQVSFKSGAKFGNAVIAVYDGENCTGNILWSWHIWKPSTEPKAFACSAITSDGSARYFDMLNTNLGAMNNEVNDVQAYGLFYQWGRKDPFPGVQTLTGSKYPDVNFGLTTPDFPEKAECTVETGTIAYSIKNPWQWLASPAHPAPNYGIRDWLYLGNHDTRLWGNPNTTMINASGPVADMGSKSIYDPCPPGWRVPPSDVWWKFKTNNKLDLLDGENGIWANMGPDDSLLFFPAAGSRYHLIEGFLSQPGKIGGYWMSTNHVNGTAPDSYVHSLYYSFDLTSPSVTLLDFDYRSFGHSIRCTSEP